MWLSHKLTFDVFNTFNSRKRILKVMPQELLMSQPNYITTKIVSD